MPKKPVTIILDLEVLREGVPALTPALARVHAEAAAVCLDDRGHRQGVHLEVLGKRSPLYVLHWPEVSDEMRRAHSDLVEATERGACGIAILLAREITGLTAIQRSMRTTGFDYWLGDADSTGLPFQQKARLEVSGILSGTMSQIKTRINQKLEQTRQSDDLKITAYVVVVEFVVLAPRWHNDESHHRFT